MAARWLGDRKWKPGVMLAVSGFGDGEHLRVLLGVLPATARVFVGEADAKRLRSTLEHEDLADVLADPRLLLGVGELDDAFFQPLARDDIVEVTDVDPVVFSPEYNKAPSYYAQFFRDFARQVDVQRKLFGTRVVDAALWQANTFANLPLLGPAPDVSALRGAFTGRAMVLVSAGPSLDESLDFVAAVQDRAVVVAVNSSYRALRHAGVIPHLVLAADPRGFTVRGFSEVPVDETWLVTTPIVDPKVAGLFEGRCFTWSGANELFTEIRRRCGLAPGTSLVERGTVSACAIDLAVLTGCDRVCFVGQDVAVCEDGRSHAHDSFYTDLDSNHVDASACRRLPGNTLPEVPVEEKLYVYLKTFEQLVAGRPQLQFLNTARLGARIAGVPYATFAAAREWIGSARLAGVRETLAARHASRGAEMDIEHIGLALEPTREYVKQILALALKTARLLESISDEASPETARDDTAISKALESAGELDRRLNRGSSDYAVLEAGRTRLELHRSRAAAGRIAPGPESWRRAMEARETAWALAEGAWFLSGWLEKITQAASGVRKV